MTEEEAKTKWCPFAEGGARGGNIHQPYPDGMPLGTHCIGSACMAWRWSENHGLQAIIPTNGHCGLAGTP